MKEQEMELERPFAKHIVQLSQYNKLVLAQRCTKNEHLQYMAELVS